MPDKSYKERNGTTRAGDFLRSIKGVAPDILNLAGSVTGFSLLNKLKPKIYHNLPCMCLACTFHSSS